MKKGILTDRAGGGYNGGMKNEQQRGILVMNVGSTSCKMKFFVLPELAEVFSLRFECLGAEEGATCTLFEGGGRQEVPCRGVNTYRDAVGFLLRRVDASCIAAVGFKTVLSSRERTVAMLTDELVADMRSLAIVCPAHNPPYADAVEQCRSALPGVPLVGCFETNFHRTIPLCNRIYGLPYEWAEKYGVQKNGFHGASHEYASSVAAARGCDKVICCHLGGSSSVCAVSGGTSLDVSFGFSPQSGVIQLYRAGDTDNAIVPWLRQCGLSEEEIEKGFSVNGGLRGIAGIRGDMREILADGSARSRLAVDAYVASIVRYVGAFYAELGGLDALTFSGGIGENAPFIRRRVCEAVRHFGIRIDAAKNEENAQDITAESSAVRVFVVPADEELVVAAKTAAFLQL